MKKVILAGVAAVAIIGSTAVYAQHRHHHHRMSMEDRNAFADAKIASVKAGLQLTPEQEKLWPPVETAVRDFAKQRIAMANARASERDARRAERDEKGSQDRGPGASADQPKDPVARLRDRADRMAETATSLKKIADAAEPLYKSLDDGQKRRLTMLTRMGGHHGWRGRGFEGDRDGGRFDRDRGPGRDRGAGDSERL